MERKDLMRIVKILNKERDLLEKVGEEKIPVVGKGTKLEDMQENFKKIMLALDDAELIDETPEDCIDFWEEHLDEFIGEEKEPEEEEEEVEEEKIEEEELEKEIEEEEEEEVEEEVEEKVEEEEVKEIEKKKKAPISKGKTRIEIMTQVFFSDPDGDKEKILEKADKLYLKEGGSSNINESKSTYGKVSKVYRALKDSGFEIIRS